jgi:hypothetical protein
LTGTVQGRRREYAIRHLDFESGQVTGLFREERPGWLVFERAVSPDQAWILYVERPAPTSELRLMENFR